MSNEHTPVKAIFDYDYLMYQAGFACETRWVDVTHKESGRVMQFKNQTEFWGRKKNVIEGWLGEKNKERVEEGKREFTKDEFEIETKRKVEDIAKVLHTVKIMINEVLLATGCEEYIGFVGKGDSFRLDRSTMLKYKGNRDDVLRPLAKDDIAEYLIKHHNAYLVEPIKMGNQMIVPEADDRVIMEYNTDPENSVIIAIDKDTGGNAVHWLNPNDQKKGIVDCNCFGELEIVEKTSGGKKTKQVKGYGRKFFYFQVAYGDDVDNYRANAFSDFEWGEISAYDALAGCTTDKECFEALIDVYKTLYPATITREGWRGDEITVDWLYAMNENWDLARMLRYEDDIVTASDVLKNFKLID